MNNAPISKIPFDFYVNTELLIPINGSEFLIDVGLFGYLNKDLYAVISNPSNSVIPTKYKINDYKKVPENKRKLINDFMVNFWCNSPQRIKDIIHREVGEFLTCCQKK
ncbi:MAG: hypothetical protein AABY22_20870 [Nanoarchaeota archaeon]